MKIMSENRFWDEMVNCKEAQRMSNGEFLVTYQDGEVEVVKVVPGIRINNAVANQYAVVSEV